MTPEFDIISAAYHRNGVAGVGFYVALIDSRVDGEARRMLYLDFDGDGGPKGYVAVLDHVLLCRGNIGSRAIREPETGVIQEGTGDNAWRGDEYALEVRDAVRSWVDRSVQHELDAIPDADKQVEVVHLDPKEGT